MPSQPLSMKKTRAAVFAQGRALNEQADFMLRTGLEVKRLDEVVKVLDEVVLSRGLWGRLRWLVTGH